MTNVTHQNTSEIGEIQAHLCLISEQSSDDFLAIAYHQQKNNLFVLSKEKRTFLLALRLSAKSSYLKNEIYDSEIKLAANEKSLAPNFKERQDSLNGKASLFFAYPNTLAKLRSEPLFKSQLKKANS